MNKSIGFFLGVTLLLWTADGQAALTQRQNTGYHDVHITHPVHGPSTQSVHESGVKMRHPESRPREGVTGKNLGCKPPYGQDCATKKQQTNL